MGHQSGSSKNKAIQSRTTMSWIVSALIVGAMSAQDTKPLPAPVSPGQAIQDAARASVREGPQAPPKNVEILYGGQAKSGAVEIISDTKGVDFGPYLREVLADLRSNWYKLIPADAQTKKGKVAIEFAILPDGRIAALKLVATSGRRFSGPRRLGGNRSFESPSSAAQCIQRAEPRASSALLLQP
jgi:hypothetical protein